MKKPELKFLIREAVGNVMREMAKPSTRAVNKELHALTVNKYFKSIPAQEIQAILDKYGMGINVETNERVMDGIYTGHEGRMSEPIGRTQQGKANVFFTMTWYKMPTGNFEIVTYVW